MARAPQPQSPGAQRPSWLSNWIVAPGALMLMGSAFAWTWLLNITWSLFLLLLPVVFIPLFWLARKQIRADGKPPFTAHALPAVAAVVASTPLAAALIAPVDLVNRLDLTQPVAVRARVMTVEQKSDWYGRSSRQLHYYTLNLAEGGREILLRGYEKSPRFRSGEDASICRYRGWLGYPVHGLPPCTQTLMLE